MSKLKELKKLIKNIKRQGAFFPSLPEKVDKVITEFESFYSLSNQNSITEKQFQSSARSLFTEISGYQVEVMSEQIVISTDYWLKRKDSMISFGRESCRLFCEMVEQNPSHKNSVLLQRLRDNQAEIEGDDRFKLI